MPMTPSEWAHANDIFHRAVLLTETARRAFIARECGDNAELCAQVESLVQCHRDTTLIPPRREIPSGTRIGVYDIVEFIAAGGMGEVYKAKDTRLKRDVALKILPESFASDPNRLARFQREAEVLASLSHPNIASIYGLEVSDGIRALVMEFVDGETLDERIAGGPIPLDEALPIVRQIAEALEAAHEQGIIHRDLKPANIKVTPSGQVKVLDFGLAKALEPAATASATLSPTITSPAVTGVGVLLGTAAYMAPEQARGKAVDKRTDIWSFGCVLYEMLTGRHAFDGEDASDTLANVQKSEPDWNALPAQTPASIRTLLRQCLHKDRKQRIADIAVALFLLTEPEDVSVTAAPITRHGRRERVTWALLGVGMLGLMVLAVPATLYVRRAAPEPRVTRLDIVTGSTTDPFVFALSPDARQLVFVANGDNGSQLWLRRFDQVIAQPLPGTGGGTYPFWSPDTHSIGFFADLKLKRLDLGGGAPQVLADAPSGRGGTWNRDGIIVFAPSNNGTLMRVPATGGTVLPVTKPGEREGGDMWPQFMPDGRRLLFFRLEGNPPAPSVYLGALKGGEPIRVMAADTAAVFSPPDQLLALRQDTLIAQHFDPVLGSISGDAIPVAQSVGTIAGGRAFHSAFSSSDTGVMAYRTGIAAQRELVWLDRSGKQLGILWPRDDASLAGPMLTRDGKRVAVTRLVQGNFDVWTMDVDRSTISRFTDNPSNDVAPVWSPDGSRVIFRSGRNGKFDLFVKPANGGGDEQSLLVTDQNKQSLDWSSDGRFVLYATQDPETGSDLWALPLDGEHKPVAIARNGFDESQGQFSPDGRWVAYVSNETGRYEIYVRPFPDAGGKWQVSTAGGIYPRWRLDGHELFYIGLDNRLMAVQIDLGTATRTVTLRPPVALFPTRLATAGNNGVAGYAARPQYAVAADGRFLMNVAADDVTPPITIVQNWQEELKRLVPTR